MLKLDLNLKRKIMCAILSIFLSLGLLPIFQIKACGLGISPPTQINDLFDPTEVNETSILSSFSFDGSKAKITEGQDRFSLISANMNEVDDASSTYVVATKKYYQGETINEVGKSAFELKFESAGEDIWGNKLDIYMRVGSLEFYPEIAKGYEVNKYRVPVIQFTKGKGGKHLNALASFIFDKGKSEGVRAYARCQFASSITIKYAGSTKNYPNDKNVLFSFTDLDQPNKHYDGGATMIKDYPANPYTECVTFGNNVIKTYIQKDTLLKTSLNNLRYSATQETTGTNEEKRSGVSVVAKSNYFDLAWAGSNCGTGIFGIAEVKGAIRVKKVSKDENITKNNSAYSLQGAKFGIYRDSSAKVLLREITTNTDGVAVSNENGLDLFPGRYWIKETHASNGYAKSDDIIAVDVVGGKVSDVGNAKKDGNVVFLEVPKVSNLDIAVAKQDKFAKETSDPELKSGSSQLKGAEFVLQFYDGQIKSESEIGSAKPLRSWIVRTDEDGKIRLNEDYKISGSDFYVDSKGQPSLPIGTLVIEETKAPVGYVRNANKFFKNITDVTNEDEHIKIDLTCFVEQIPIRGDIEFVKCRETNQERLSKIPFLITSKTTGEKHVVVTDENGQAKTDSSWNLHTSNTNKNDLALSTSGEVDESMLSESAGVWFSGFSDNVSVDPNDEFGALPFDDYEIEELRVSANEGLELIKLGNVKISRNDASVNLGTFDNQDQRSPEITTVVRDFLDDDKQVDALKNQSVVDKVYLKNLKPQTSYVLKATLMNKNTGEKLGAKGRDDDFVEKNFVAEDNLNDGDGFVDLTQEVKLNFDADHVAGDEIVVFEELREANTSEVLASDNSFENESQTFIVKDKVNEQKEVVDDAEPDIIKSDDQKASHISKASAKYDKKGGLAKTGDNRKFYLFIVSIIVISAAGISSISCFIYERKKRRRSNHNAIF